MHEVHTANSSLKRRYGGLDLLRVVSAAMVCLCHSTIHLGCTYGILQSLSDTAYVYMTAFFMLSGFSLFLNWSGRPLSDKKAILFFWKKRVLRVMPIYWASALASVVWLLAFKHDTWINELVVAPIEILGMQNVFHSLAGVSHNPGTWFVSCMLICYAAYPFLQELIKQFSLREKAVSLLALTAFLLYAPIITQHFHTETVYSDPFFRLLEFTIGVLLAALKAEMDKKQIVLLYKWRSIALAATVLLVGVTVADRAGIFAGDHMFYSWISLPCFSVLLLGLSGAKSDVLDRSRALKYLSNLSYSFYLAQLFSFQPCKLLIARFSIESNLAKILLGWSSTFLIALCIHRVELLLNRFTKRYE